MARAAFALAAAAVAACAVLAGAEVRSRQMHAPAGLRVTSNAVLATAQSNEDSLYKVVTYFDVQYDGFFSGGIPITWMPPTVFVYDFGYWKQYVEPGSCLGPAGPLGSRGPLSTYGALSNPNATIASMSKTIDQAWFDALESFMQTWWDGPMGSEGPLGEDGPLAQSEVYSTMYHLNQAIFNANVFPANLDITGVWGVLGPLGPLGALGPLGPLGPNGPHGFRATTGGDYIDSSGAVQRTVHVQFTADGNTWRVYGLVEVYTPARATELGYSNDASFMTDVQVSGSSLVCFPFTSTYTQTVTVLAVPSESPADGTTTSVSVSLQDGSSGATLATGNTDTGSFDSPTGLVNFVVSRAAQGQKLRACASAVSSSGSGYARLVVTGTGFLEGRNGRESDVDAFNHWNIEGPHQTH